MTTAQGSRTIRFLQKGKDGKGVQYIYYRTAILTAPATPSADYASDGWTDTPQGVTHAIPYEWVSTRAQDNGTWGAFSTPALWTNFASDGLRENKFSSQTNIYNAGKNETTYMDKDLRGFSATLVNGESNRIRLHPLIDKNGKWTVSGYIKAAAACTVSVDICDNGDSTLQVGTSYSYFTITANVANQSGTYNFVDFSNTWGYNIALTVKDLKVEFGAYATAYCLAEIDKVGEKGDKGDKGDQGDPGADGAPGEKGEPGLQGRTIRRSEWQEGVEYRNDETTTAEDGNRYLDIVCFTSDNKATGWWQCRTTHTATTATKPSVAGSTAQWTKLNNLAPTYIPLLLADDADISLIGTRQITVKNADGQVVMGMTGHSASSAGEETGVRFFVGSAPNADDVTFSIDKDGIPRTKGTFLGEYYDLGNLRLLDHDHFNSTELAELFGKGIYNLSLYSPKDSSGKCAVLPFATNDWAGSRFGKDSSLQACIMNRWEAYDTIGAEADYVYISGNFYGNTHYAYESSQGTKLNAGTRVAGIYLAPGSMLRLRSFRGSQSAVDGLEWTIENAEDFILHQMHVSREDATGTMTELSPGSAVTATDTLWITLISKRYIAETLHPSDWKTHIITH